MSFEPFLNLIVPHRCSVLSFSLPSGPDAPPRSLNVTATSNGLRITWDSPAVLSGPTSYLVQVTSIEFHF